MRQCFDLNDCSKAAVKPGGPVPAAQNGSNVQENIAWVQMAGALQGANTRSCGQYSDNQEQTSVAVKP
jgi:hypothetical protein